ncbi:MAG: aminodeoxychorismate synthase component I [Candidatus Omnitrophota bacterium]
MNDDELLYSTLLTLKKQNNFVFLYNGKPDKENKNTCLFLNPIEIISTVEFTNIKNCFNRIESALANGCYVAGYISYEAGFAFEGTLPIPKVATIPLLWFGVYRNFLHPAQAMRPVRGPSNLGSYNIKNIQATKTQQAYLSDIKKIKKYIRVGDTYQVNYTFKYKFSFSGSPYRLFFDLNKKQSVPYAAFISFDSNKILSLSPELFFRKNANLIKVKPMKGTADRGKDTSHDLIKQKLLEASAKNRAENIMIVDMLRNDLGRISVHGSVRTTRLFETEKYQTLFQMTSTVQAKLMPNTDYLSIFKAIFPSGSVTGAPKIRTMQIINELEAAPRNIYTGAIGYMSPEREAVFNVGIRTVLINEGLKRGEMGIGSGITIASDPKEEFDECALKANFLVDKNTGMGLIETLLWQNEKIFLLDLHLKRLRASAEYFGYKYSREHIVNLLKLQSKHFEKSRHYKIRLLLKNDGSVKINSDIVAQTTTPSKIVFSKAKVNSSDIFLYHKTTIRGLYNSEYAKFSKKGYADVIFQNEKGEITEGAISNVIIKKGKAYCTPPVTCGLLNGVYRQHLLKTRPFPIKEKALFKKDIVFADKLFICNSVRGLIEVTL